MAAMTPMMAAIAAAKKAKQSSTGKASKTFTVGDLVQYWSDSKNKWINATVLERREESGSTLYDLDVRKGAKIDRVRERPDGPSKEIGKKAGGASGGVAVAATSGSPFASFDAFDMRQSKKRGRDDSDDDVCPASRAEAKASIDWSNPPEDLVPPLDETFVRSEAGGVSIEGAWLSHSEQKAFRSEEHLRKVKDMLAPLLVLLAKGGGDEDVLARLNEMAVLALKRNYIEVNKAYLEFTMGKKRWCDAGSIVTGQQNHGGCINIRKRDPLITYDKDPVLQKYVWGLRRLIQFMQIVRPHPDGSKHM
eukprot:TRINITY_DN6655_c0_g1_i3.p1 TRINITY_DN6655_c0_g1~~TRINITY_DN6655_c0_g1_i3.p1  ORF type:complete len:338 (-),score=69.62 TRINITY_DN6655_c0_g1_i3:98-1015(-)